MIKIIRIYQISLFKNIYHQINHPQIFQHSSKIVFLKDMNNNNVNLNKKESKVEFKIKIIKKLG